MSEPDKVAVLGPLGTYTHEAAYQRFGSRVEYDERDTIRGVFEALSSTSHVGVVPQENTIFGTVIETYDTLRERGFVRGDITLQVQHCLLARQGVQLNHIRRILSHEQALGQCHGFIRAHLSSDVSLIKTASTAAAARALLDEPPDCAAICSRVCATLFDGLSILREGIQDVSENFTRFYVITRNEAVQLPQSLLHRMKSDNALLRISTMLPSSSVPGSGAQHISQLLSTLGMDITRLDRRPSLETVPFHDVYFVEVARKKINQSSLESDWRLQIGEAMERVTVEGGTARLIGIWE